jgi:hypothetical protein
MRASPATSTVTPGRGTPVSSVIVPVSFPSKTVWLKAEWLDKKASVRTEKLRMTRPFLMKCISFLLSSEV